MAPIGSLLSGIPTLPLLNETQVLQVSLPLPQVKTTLDSMSQKTAAFTDVGSSLAHVQHLLKDLSSFEEKSSVRVRQGWKGGSHSRGRRT